MIAARPPISRRSPILHLPTQTILHPGTKSCVNVSRQPRGPGWCGGQLSPCSASCCCGGSATVHWPAPRSPSPGGRCWPAAAPPPCPSWPARRAGAAAAARLAVVYHDAQGLGQYGRDGGELAGVDDRPPQRVGPDDQAEFRAAQIHPVQSRLAEVHLG